MFVRRTCWKRRKTAGYRSIVWRHTHHTLLVHSSVRGHPGCLHVSAVVPNVALGRGSNESTKMFKVEE